MSLGEYLDSKITVEREGAEEPKSNLSSLLRGIHAQAFSIDDTCQRRRESPLKIKFSGFPYN